MGTSTVVMLKPSSLAESERGIENSQKDEFNARLTRGEFLAEIRDKRQYREAGYASFDDYVWARWGWKKDYCNKLISCCFIYRKLNTLVFKNNEQKQPLKFLAHETQIRPLTTLKSDDELIQAWETAVEMAAGKPPTEKIVKEAVNRIKDQKRQAAIAGTANPEPEKPESPAAPETDQDESESYVLVAETSPQPNPQPTVPEYILLEEWKSLDAAVQSQYLRGIESDKTFNKQDNDSIEWAQWSWNPITGCRHNCSFCYARDIAERWYKQKFEPAFIPDRLRAPCNMSVPEKARDDIAYRNVFVCSMADLFGRWVPAQWIEAVLQQVRDNPQWNFLFLTKFPKRLVEFEFPKNAWLGTTVDHQKRVKNAEDAFAKLSGGTKWLSVEPMLEPLQFSRLELFDWIVIGGASRSNQTPAWVPPVDWLVDLHNQARRADCRIYYKTNCGMQDSLRIREFPWVEPKQKVLPKALRYWS